jgi:hypothetical protein
MKIYARLRQCRRRVESGQLPPITVELSGNPGHPAVRKSLWISDTLSSYLPDQTKQLDTKNGRLSSERSTPNKES